MGFSQRVLDAEYQKVNQVLRYIACGCRMQNWESQAGSTSCMRPGAKFHSLPHKQEGSQQQGNDYLVSLADWTGPKQEWRVVRLVGMGPQQDGVHRSPFYALALASLCLSLPYSN